MKLPSLPITQLPLLMVLAALIGVGLNTQFNGPSSSSSGLASAPSTQPGASKSAGTHRQTNFVLGSDTTNNTNAAASSAATSHNATSGSSAVAAAPTLVAGSGDTDSSSTAASSTQSSSSPQQSMPLNPCASCPISDNSGSATACPDYCVPSSTPPISGCGVCNVNNNSYPTLHHVCPMYCAPLE